MKKYIYALLFFTATIPAVSQKPILQWYNFVNTSSNVGYGMHSSRDALILTQIVGGTYSDYYATYTILNGKATSESFELVDPSQKRFSTVYLEDSTYYKIVWEPTMPNKEVTYYMQNGEKVYHVTLKRQSEEFGYQGNNLIVVEKHLRGNTWDISIRRYDQFGIISLEKEYSFEATESYTGPTIFSINPVTISYANEILIFNEKLDVQLRKRNQANKTYSVLSSKHPFIVFQTSETGRNQADSVFQYNFSSNELISGALPDSSRTIWYDDNTFIHLFSSSNTGHLKYIVTTMTGKTLFRNDAPYLKSVTPLSDGGLAENYYDHQQYPINKPSEVPAKIIKRSKDFSEEWSHSFLLNQNSYQSLTLASGPRGSVYFLLHEEPYREPYFRPVYENNKFYYGELASKTEECPPVYLSYTLNGGEICDSTLYSKLWLTEIDSLVLTNLNIHPKIQWYENGEEIEGATNFSLKYDSLNNHQFKLTQEGCETYSKLINEPKPIHFEIVPDRPEIGCNPGDEIIIQYKINDEFIDPVWEYKGFAESPFRFQGTNFFRYYQPRTLDIHLQKRDNACLTAHQTFEIKKKAPVPQPTYILEEYGVVDPEKWGQSTQITGIAHFEVLNPITDYSYEWFNNNEPTGITGIRFDAVKSGNYTVKSTKDECFSMSQSLKLTLIPLSTEKENSWKVYPNPSSEIIRVQWNDSFDASSFRIFDTNAKAVKEGKIDNAQNGTHDIQVSHLPPGNYIIHVFGSGTDILTGRFSKRN